MSNNKDTDIVYSSDSRDESNRDPAAMSEKVQTIASGIYNEFQHMIKVYDENVVKRLMPLVVGVLEGLNQSYLEKQEIDVEIELLKTDNEQLLTQYEREKNMRRETEQKYLETEDIIDENKKLFDIKFDKVENSLKLFELKARNAQEHVSRFEERELEMKNEYQKLHDRYTELFKKHADVLDRSKYNNIDYNADFSDRNIDYLEGDFERERSSTKDSFTDSELNIDKKLFSETESLNNEDSKSKLNDSCERRISMKDELNNAEKAPLNLYGIGKEVEILIQENKELLATKNALNIVKDDLIERVDTITSEHDMLKERQTCLLLAKDKMSSKLEAADEEVKKLRAQIKEMEEAENDKKPDEPNVPAAQRKRFTRMEMARVLMERNKYKERLFELQEAVRWAETIRAARDHPDDTAKDNKKKSGGVWSFFSNMFNSQSPPSKSSSVNSSPAKSASPQLKYTKNELKDVSTIRPVGDPNKADRNKIGLGAEKAYDFLDEDERLRSGAAITCAAVAGNIKREESDKQRYKSVHARVDKDDGRMQAYGWSIPITSTKEKQQKIPIPVYNKHMFPNRESRQLWCASGVNTYGGQTKDGDHVVGASVFYATNKQVNDDKKAVDRIEEISSDLEKHAKIDECQEDDKNSLIWVCSSTIKTMAHDDSNAKVTIFDASSPSKIISEFSPSRTPIICMASIPGSSCDDYSSDYSDIELSPSITPPTTPAHPFDATTSKDTQQVKVKRGHLQLITCSVSNTSSSKQQRNKNTSSSASSTSSSINDDSASIRTEDSVSSSSEHLLEFPLVGPTMWLGSQSGSLYIHSTISSPRHCLASVKLKDSICCIVHTKGRVFVGLANGSIAIFDRSSDGSWDTSKYHLLKLGNNIIKCACVVDVTSSVWFTIKNIVYIINPKNFKITDNFKAHPREDSQVRQMKSFKDGVWLSMHLDSCIRLYNSHAPYKHLQDLDIEPIVATIFGNGKLGFIFVRINTLMIDAGHLWIGTSNGVVISLPIVQEKLDTTSVAITVRPGGCARVYCDDGEDAEGGGTGGGGGGGTTTSGSGGGDEASGVEGIGTSDGGGTVEINSSSSTSCNANMPSTSGEACSSTTTTTTTSTTSSSSSGGGGGGRVVQALATPLVNADSARISFHGHKDVVNFLVAVAGKKKPTERKSTNTLVLSGGDSYTDHRIPAEDDSHNATDLSRLKHHRESHLIIWQLQ